MSLVKAALLQMTASGHDQEANLANGEAFCRRAKEMGAEIALFPEMWNFGYTFADPPPDECQRSLAGTGGWAAGWLCDSL